MPRPKKPEGERLVNVSASLPPELVARLDAQQAAERRPSRSNIIAALLERALGAGPEQPRQEQPRQAG